MSAPSPPSEKSLEESQQAAIDWIRSRPRSLHDVMVKFPPNCLVRATRRLHVPAPGKTARVKVYIDNKQEDEMPSVRVVEEPDGDVLAECQTDWIEVVSYWEWSTPDFVKIALEGA
jgi:hypothetical protein